MYLIIIFLTLSLGFSTLADESFKTDRSSSFELSEKNEGVLDLDLREEVRRNSIDEFLVHIQNNLEETQQIEVEIEDSEWEIVSSNQFQLSSSESREISVDTGDIEEEKLEYQLISQIDNSTTFKKDVEVDIVDPAIELTQNVRSVGSSGRYSFDIINDGGRNVTLNSISILSTTSDEAEFVDGGDIFTVNDEQIVNERIEIGEGFYEFNQDVLLKEGSTLEFKFDRFRREGRGRQNVDMRGEDVLIELDIVGEPPQLLLLEEES